MSHEDTSGLTFQQTKGCPQGSVLGPTFWNIIAESFLSQFNMDVPDNFLIAYADDLIMVNSGQNVNKLFTNNKYLPSFEIWLEENKLQTSKEKTSLTVIVKKNNKKPKKPPSYRLQGYKVKHTPTFKFLGLTFNHILSWKSHIDTLETKLFQKNNDLAKVAAKTWGVPSSLQRTWYVTVIEKILSYASGIWASQISLNLTKKLYSIQRPFLLKMSRAYRTAPSAALCVLTQVLPLHLAITQEFHLAQSLRLNKPLNLQRLNSTNEEIDTKKHHLLIHPSIYHLPNVKIKQDQTLKTQFFSIYTDGSKTQDGVGSAFVVFKGEKIINQWKSNLPQYSSIFQSELKAIQEAILWLQRNQIKHASIFSDSQSALQAIKLETQRNQQIQEIQVLLINARENNYFYTLNWIKGHSGNLGNDTADGLAKEATKLNNTEQGIRIPISYAKRKIKEQMMLDWQTHWDIIETSRYTHNLIPKVQLKQITQTPWQTAILTNHGPFTQYLHRFNRARSRFCTCGEVGDAIHFATQCNITKEWHIARLTHTNKQEWVNQILNNKTVISKLKQLYLWLMENSENLISPLDLSID